MSNVRIAYTRLSLSHLTYKLAHLYSHRNSHRASTTGHDALVRLLLNPPGPKNGAKREKTRVNPQDRLGNTPLHLAFDSGHGSTAVVLIEEGGADRNRLNQDEQKPEEMPGTNEIEQRKVLAYVHSKIG